MRAKTNWNTGVPDDSCEETTYGETEDYSVNIDLSIGLNEGISKRNGMILSYLPENHFSVSYESLNANDDFYITVHNSFGQNVLYNRVYSNDGIFSYEFDMSYAAPGVYLVRLGNDEFGMIKKIVVK